MPFGDWQFWVVTLVTVAAAVVAVRPFLPRRRPRPPRVRLTIGGKRR